MSYSAIGERPNIQIINKIENEKFKIEVLEYQELLGMSDMSLAIKTYFMQKQNMRPRQVALYLNGNTAKMQAGAMSYIRGNIDMVSGVTVGNLVGKIFKGAVTKESMAQPVYTGTGMIVSEPSFKHFFTLNLAPNEKVIVDKGMFYCSEGTVDVAPHLLKNISSAFLGGEGFFQLALTGPGIVVLECEVPMSEIQRIQLQNDTLKVDGNFAVLRSAGIDFTVEMSSKGLMSSVMSGEGLVNVYRGTGEIWLAPTLKIYQTMKMAQDFGSTDLGTINMNTSNSNKSKV